MDKVFKGLSPYIVKEIFQFTGTVLYQLRIQTDFQIPSVHSVFSYTESITLSRLKIWKISAHETKLEILKEFKKAIKQRNVISSPCSLCKTCIQNLFLFDIKSYT